MVKEPIEKTKAYHEPYRNQFHFSPREGWMNDVNGVWYADGWYHLTYQADEKHLCSTSVGWGHAVSRDLLHWVQKPMALEPGVNTVGQAYSGTAVVDIYNTAGFGRGTAILIYTDSCIGQCLNYWEESRQEFVPYEHNPIIVLDEAGQRDGLEPGVQRDPKVFWDERTQQWILMIYRERDPKHGQVLQVYRSPNLKQWERLEDFLQEDYRECPNVYPLRLDGGEQKWVIQAASGRYCIGYFDGERFIVEQDFRKNLLGGRDAYAGQTFVNMPDDRTVYMCWLDDWSGSTIETEPWRNAASFPYELDLRTLPDGSWHIFANPIQEIEQLYNGATCRTEGQWVDTEQNPFERCIIHQVDMTMVFDLTNTEATSLFFQIKGKELQYIIKEHVLCSNTSVITTKDSWGTGEYRLECPCCDGKLKMRLLIDNDSLEIVFQDGQRLYMEEYGFEPDAERFSVTADARVWLEYAEWTTIRSIWD